MIDVWVKSSIAAGDGRCLMTSDSDDHVYKEEMEDGDDDGRPLIDIIRCEYVDVISHITTLSLSS